MKATFASLLVSSGGIQMRTTAWLTYPQTTSFCIQKQTQSKLGRIFQKKLQTDAANGNEKQNLLIARPVNARRQRPWISRLKC